MEGENAAFEYGFVTAPCGIDEEIDVPRAFESSEVCASSVWSHGMRTTLDGRSAVAVVRPVAKTLELASDARTQAMPRPAPWRESS
jgi:hypothetical protein